MSAWSFEGPYSVGQLFDEPGVYIVIDVHAGMSDPFIDVGESSKVATRVRSHDRKRCWEIFATRGQYAFVVMYTWDRDAKQRRRMERIIREYTSPLCGDL